MRVIFTGRGTSGSWQCRGVQLGGEIGDAIPKATDFTGYDLIVLVKRPAKGQIEAIKRSGIPWVWDIVDFYPQPQCTLWSKEQAVSWGRAQIESAKPNAVIWPNAKMATDCNLPVTGMVLYHHHRPIDNCRSVSNALHVIGYEGSPRYLGRWGKVIKQECRARGLTFTTEGTPWNFDAVVAFRDNPVNGYVQKHWKSNVKLANAHGAGVPFIGYPECGYLETSAGAELWCVDPSGIGECLDTLMDADRQSIADQFKRNAYPLYQAATDLQTFLSLL